jgi:hypothetical protein
MSSQRCLRDFPGEGKPKAEHVQPTKFSGQRISMRVALRQPAIARYVPDFRFEKA